MSNQSDLPQPDLGGTSASQSPTTPPAGYQPPPAQSYQQPGQPQSQQFPIPSGVPRSFDQVMPKGGFTGIFSVAGMPTELQVSYWIWVIGGLLSILVGMFGFFASVVALALIPAVGIVLLLLVLVLLALAVAQVVLAMKMKEGKSWARLALTVIAGISLAISLVQSGIDGGVGWFGSVLGVVAVVLMWLPKSRPWFEQRMPATY